MKRKAAFKKKRQNRFGMFLAATVVVMLLVVISVKNAELREKQEAYALKVQSLTEQIEAEQKRSEEIAEYKKYTRTKKYVEEVAKDKLGMVYEGEIIFQTD